MLGTWTLHELYAADRNLTALEREIASCHRLRKIAAHLHMGYVIPERRGELELSLSALAKRLGLTRPYVAYLQAGSGQTSLTFSSAVYLSY